MTVEIPIAERYSNLRELLLRFAQELSAALKHKPDLLNGEPSDAFWILALPWLIEAEAPALNEDTVKILKNRKAEIQKTGFDGDTVARDLLKVRSEDLHLAECCPTLVLLARHFSRNFLHDAVAILQSHQDPAAIVHLYEEFEQRTYSQGRFRRSAFTHVFNLDIDGRDLDLGDLRIIRLNPDFKTTVLGEKSPQPFLHPPGLGDCFIFSNEPAGELNDDAWLQLKRAEASRFVAVLQYFKPGLVHIGYTAPAFYPDWADQIRRSGLFFIGEPRRNPHDLGRSMYKIEPSERDLLVRYWSAIKRPKIAAVINDGSSKLRQAVLRAGEYYEKSHASRDAPERLICLAIALEALFSPENQEQLRFRISHSAAQYLGATPQEKEAIFESVQELYKRRNSIVHGGYDVDKFMNGTLVSQDELNQWSDLIRRSVLGFFVLALQGETSRIQILKQLENAAFDDHAADDIRRKSMVENFLADQDELEP